MNTKLLIAIGCLIFLASGTMPTALGHDDRAIFGGDTDGVSGFYLGAAGPAIAENGDANPAGTRAVGSMLCDMEVTEDGDSASNEDHVDGHNGGGIVPDTYDDGGFGGACHVNSYETEEFNTPGCPDADAFALDALGDAWISAACDWKSDEGGISGNEALLFCLVDGVPTASPPTIAGCFVEFVDCLTDPSCGATGATQACGADAAVDAINFGWGSGGVAYPRSAFATFGCQDIDSTAQVFVWDAVVTGPGDAARANLASSGEIWQGAVVSCPVALSKPKGSCGISMSFVAGGNIQVTVVVRDSTGQLVPGATIEISPIDKHTESQVEQTNGQGARTFHFTPTAGTEFPGVRYTIHFTDSNGPQVLRGVARFEN